MLRLVENTPFKANKTTFGYFVALLSMMAVKLPMNDDA
jgi:hypothetical protein